MQPGNASQQALKQRMDYLRTIGVSKKTNIDDAILNMVFTLEATDYDNGVSYFDDLNLYGALGSTPVRISILDSGISDDAFNANPDYSGPVSYTGYDYVDDDPIPNDVNGHGTRIAGLIYDIRICGR